MTKAGGKTGGSIFKFWLMATVAMAGAGGTALAQDAGDESFTEDRIIVTAQRREQTAQEVGIALNVFSGEDLASRGIETVNNLENFVPNLEIESQFGSGIPSFSIRGVGFRDYASLNAPTVGIYVDDVVYPYPAMTQGLLFDIDRVEVLRGPQGTLYGRNTTGGAIKFISARPTEELSAGISLEYARFDRFEAEGYVSGSVADGVRLRVSGITAHGGAWQENRETGEELGDEEKYAGRVQLEADLGERFQALLNLHGALDKSDGLGLQLFNDSVLGPLAHADQRGTSYGSSAEFAALVGFDTDQKPFRDNESWGINLTLTGDLGPVSVTYIGAYEAMDREEFNDFDALTIGGAGVYFQTDIDVTTHELRLNGTVADRFNWVGGVFYSAEDLEDLYQSDFVASFGDGFAVSTPYTQDVETIAVFAHGDYALTDQFTLVGGIRYEHEERDLNDLGTFATGFGPLNFANGTVDGTLENRSLDSDNLSGKAAIEYTPTDDMLLYASYSRGVKSGGFTAYNTLNPNALTPFTPEELDAYEIGLKSEWADGMLQFNAAAFYYDYKDQQVQSAIYDPGVDAIVGRIVNAPESEIYGIEAEAVLRPTEWLVIGQSLGYKDGEFKEFLDLDTAATAATSMEVFIDRSGQSLGFPTISYQGYAAFQAETANGYVLDGRFDYSFRDDTTPPLLGPIYRVESYWLANVELAFSPIDGPWQLAMFGRNIFDTDYDETRNFFIAPGAVADVAAPGRVATYGVRLRYTY